MVNLPMLRRHVVWMRPSRTSRMHTTMVTPHAIRIMSVVSHLLVLCAVSCSLNLHLHTLNVYLAIWLWECIHYKWVWYMKEDWATCVTIIKWSLSLFLVLNRWPCISLGHTYSSTCLQHHSPRMKWKQSLSFFLFLYSWMFQFFRSDQIVRSKFADPGRWFDLSILQ